jgi:catechol 2,3-dioxygenase-like lactoylglutathione lyase family enzyme
MPDMTVVLDHHIIPVRDKDESAGFLARILGLPFEGAKGSFASVHVGDTILDFSTRQPVPRLHYAFKVSEEEFDGVVARLQAEEVPWGSEHDGTYNYKWNERAGGRGIYFPDPCGHSWEVITATYQS